MNRGRTQYGYAIDGALKRRGALVVLDVEPSDRLDGFFDMGRKERQRDVRVGHGLFSITRRTAGWHVTATPL
jgi:hypothetical protein